MQCLQYAITANMLAGRVRALRLHTVTVGNTCRMREAVRTRSASQSEKHIEARTYEGTGSTCRMREAVRTRSALKLDTPTADVRPCTWQSARPCSRTTYKFGNF